MSSPFFEQCDEILIWGASLCLHKWHRVYANIFVCFYVCFRLFMFASLIVCVCVRMFPFQTCPQLEYFGLWRSALPLPTLSSFSRLFIHRMQRDNQSSGERGLGPFSKDTFEMARHVREENLLPCQVTSAVCGQVYLMERHINTLAWHTSRFNIHKNPNIETHTCTASPSLSHAAFHVVP